MKLRDTVVVAAIGATLMLIGMSLYKSTHKPIKAEFSNKPEKPAAQPKTYPQVFDKQTFHEYILNHPRTREILRNPAKFVESSKN